MSIAMKYIVLTIFVALFVATAIVYMIGYEDFKQAIEEMIGKDK